MFLDSLRYELSRRTDSGTVRWLDERIATIRSGGVDATAFQLVFASARRRVPANGTPVPSEDILPSHVIAFATWAHDEIVRAILLLACAERDDASFPDLIESCFRRGEIRERQAIAKALPLLPGPARFLPVAAEACRTSMQSVFEAIACENPYPAEYFPALPFNQMVLKAAFTGVQLERIAGLKRRLSGELARMADDYRRERVVAGRSVPADLTLLRAPS